MDLEYEKQKTIIHETKEAVEKIVNMRLSNVPTQSREFKFIKYKPNSKQSAAAFKERIIKMVEMAVDPVEPPKFKHKKIPRAASGSPPVPVMHSPPRPVTVKDQQDWKIPPCISNWKNPKGYTIPLDKRLVAVNEAVKINDNFAKISEALYVAEEKARQAAAMREKIQREMIMKEEERKEMQLQELARKARTDRTTVVDYDSATEEARLKRKKICEERRRERRFEAKDAKKSKISRDRDGEVSEKVALGMASSTRKSRGEEVMYDQRLFNQEKGMDSGFGFANDDAYNVYDKGLFTTQPTLSTLYKPKKDNVDSDMYGVADEQIVNTHRFKPDKAFAGTYERAGPSVEFDKEADPFGLDQFFNETMANIGVVEEP
ncbi:PREDICTED: SNW/SKI-interacting protein-like [Nicotiana attenuata]|uniref:Snwski-interacting protein n=1 Tax=Nicotiana attenuata TaxID=49451 RepID=A0A1J6IQ88_NICAT|nr:PREDICTED: SNW/SKI-interacting protein-like [Nicotiana attenuata]OIT07006.1 snwski-interacting protein [Nicotiana attenuata]